MMKPGSRFSMEAAAYAGIWLPFLAVAMWETTARLPLPAMVYTVVVFLLFSASYFFACGAIGVYPAHWRRSWQITFYAVILFGLILCVLPVVGAAAVSFTPFMTAYFSFNLKPRIAGLCVALTSALATVFAVLTKPEYIEYFLVITVVLPGLIFGLALVDIWSANKRELTAELQLVHQREAIARDVHDVLGHTLTVINLKAELAARSIDVDPVRARAEMQEIAQLSRTGLAEVRSTVTRMRQPDFAGELLAFRRALDTARIVLSVHDQAESLEPATAAVFSWALREAGTNIVRHSQATAVTVDISPNRLVITDDGIGFRVPDAIMGGGLFALEQRVTESGGTFTMMSRPGATQLEVAFATATERQVDDADSGS